VATELGWTALGVADARWIVTLVGLIAVLGDLGLALIIGLVPVHLHRLTL